MQKRHTRAKIHRAFASWRLLPILLCKAVEGGDGAIVLLPERVLALGGVVEVKEGEEVRVLPGTVIDDVFAVEDGAVVIVLYIVKK